MGHKYIENNYTYIPLKYIDYERREKLMKEQKLINVKEASEILGLKVKTLYQWKWRKQHLPFVKVGKSLKISEKDLMDFIEKGKRFPKED